MFVKGVVRTLNELYNVLCSVRTVLVRSRNTNDANYANACDFVAAHDATFVVGVDVLAGAFDGVDACVDASGAFAAIACNVVVVVDDAFVVAIGAAVPGTYDAFAFAVVVDDARGGAASLASPVVVAIVAAHVVVAVVVFLVIVVVALKLYFMQLMAFMFLRSVISMTLFDVDVFNNNGHLMYVYTLHSIYNILSINYNLSLGCKIPRRV